MTVPTEGQMFARLGHTPPGADHPIVTGVDYTPDLTVDEAVHDTTVRPDGIWPAHSPDGGPPAWVSATHPDLAARLGAYYGCPVLDWEA